MPSFSIVIPTYNGADFVEQALLSALSQSYPAYEIIISDDNSTDETLAVCKTFADRIKVFTNPKGPSGFVTGWNNAIAHASGDYIAILHQDDLLSPSFLENIAHAINLYPNVKHFFTPCNYIDREGNILRTPTEYCDGQIVLYSGQDYVHAYERVKNHIHRCPGVVTHKSIFDKCRYRVEAGHIADDDFFLRVGNYTDVVGILKPLASYREHKKSETGHLDTLSINTRLLRDYYFQLEHAEDNPLLSPEIIEIFRRREAEYIHREIIFGIKSWKLGYVGIGLKFWLKFSKRNRFGNIVYDIASIKKYIKQALIKFRLFILRRRAILSGNFKSLNVATTVIVAPHPDDEVFGCGGLVARMVGEGNFPHIVIMTGGEGSHCGCCNIPTDEIVAARRGLTRDALARLGVPQENIHELDFPDGGISSSDCRVKHLVTLMQRLNPQSVFVPHRGEGWNDHVKTAEIVKSILPVDTEVWEYCVWMWYYNVWSLDWKNARVLHMTENEYELKLRAMDAYVKPLAHCGNPWSGVLPKLFIDANSWNKELYFRSRI